MRGKSSTPNGLIIFICHLNDVLCPEANQVLTEYCHRESFLKIGPSKILSKFEKKLNVCTALLTAHVLPCMKLKISVIYSELKSPIPTVKMFL